MIALLNMTTKIGCSAIEHVIDNLVVLREKGMGLLIIDNMLTKNICDL
jgi:hypothetical protein